MLNILKFRSIFPNLVFFCLTMLVASGCDLKSKCDQRCELTRNANLIITLTYNVVEIDGVYKKASPFPSGKEIKEFFDGRLNEIKDSVFDESTSNFDFLDRTHFEYSENDLLIRETYFDSNNMVLAEYQVSYIDSQTQHIVKKLTKGEAVEMIDVITSPSRIVTASYYQGKKVDEVISLYNDCSRSTENLTFFDENGNPSASHSRIFKYLEMDGFGNWTRRVVINGSDSKAAFLEERIIEYAE